MEIGIGDAVHCIDGKCGQVEGLVVEKGSLKITDLLVKRGILSTRYIVAPFDVVHDVGDNVNIKLTTRELEGLLDLTETELVPISGKTHHHAEHQDEAVVLTTPEIAQGVPLTPVDAELEEPLLEGEIRNIPPGTVVVRKTTQVMAKGELVGPVAKIVFDPASRRLTHIMVRPGEDSKTITLPAALIASLEEERINLKLSKRDIEKLSHL